MRILFIVRIRTTGDAAGAKKPGCNQLSWRPCLKCPLRKEREMGDLLFNWE